MTLRRIEGPSGPPSDDIVDAEFTDVGEIGPAAAQPSARPAAPKQRPKQQEQLNTAQKIGLAVIGLILSILVLICIADNTSSSGNQGTSLATDNSSADAGANATDADDQDATSAPDVPPIATLLAQNDPRACDHPETVQFIREQVLPQDGSDDGLSDQEFQEAVARVRTDLTEVTAGDIRRDVHEISCDANLTYGPRDGDKFAISYTIRPSANPDGPAVYYLGISKFQLMLMRGALMARAVQEIKAERSPAPSAATPATTSDSASAPDGDATPAPAASSTPSDQDLYAPHG